MYAILYGVSGVIFGFDSVNNFITTVLEYTLILGKYILILGAVVVGVCVIYVMIRPSKLDPRKRHSREKEEEILIDVEKSDDKHSKDAN